MDFRGGNTTWTTVSSEKRSAAPCKSGERGLSETEREKRRKGVG
jgi:hypothetical protein